MNIKCAFTALVEVFKLVINPKNRNNHSEKQIEVLANIIKATGQRSPIVVSKRSGFIVKGHGRKLAIEKLGWEKCAVDYQDYENEADEYRDMIADNEIARYAEFDKAGFRSDLEEMGLDLEEINFEEFGLLNFEMIDEWESDIEKIDKIDENLDGIPAIIKITCPQDLKDEVLIYIKSKLMETSFEGVHVE